MLAQVPIAHATIGLVIVPFLTASMTLYSSTPPTSPSKTKILHSGSAWYLRRWSINVVLGYLSPPIATPSYTPSVVFAIMLLSSLDIPPDLETYPTEPFR